MSTHILSNPVTNPYENSLPTLKRSRKRIVFGCLPWGLLGLALLAIPVAWLIGCVQGNAQIYSNLSNGQETRIRELQAQHPEFAHLEVNPTSSGSVWLEGQLTEEEAAELREHLRRMFGDDLAEGMMRTVDVVP